MSATNVSASTTVAAKPQVVFAILADPSQHARIDGSGTVRGSLAGPDQTLVNLRAAAEADAAETVTKD